MNFDEQVKQSKLQQSSFYLYKTKKLLVGSGDGHIYAFDSITGKLETDISTDLSSAINAIEVSGAGKIVFTSTNGRIFQWDVTQNKRVTEYKTEDPLAPITAMTLDKDQRWIVSSYLLNRQQKVFS